MLGQVIEPNASVRFLDKKILLAYPWYASAHPLTAFSTQQLADKRRTMSLQSFGDAFLPHCRGRLADMFLKTKCEWMLSVDDDMVLPFGNAAWIRQSLGRDIPEPFASFNTIDRLLSHNKTLVGALYFGRHAHHSRPIFAEGMDNPAEAERCKTLRDLVQPCGWVGTGCLLTHRSVFEDIEKKFPCLARGSDGTGGAWYYSSEHTLLDATHRLRKMLATGPMSSEKCLSALQIVENSLAEARAISGLGTGEDVIFCRRAKQAGHQPYVDLGLLCGHVGDFVYCGK